MSRIGRLPVVIPIGVDIRVEGKTVHVKGPKGEMTYTFPPSMSVAISDNQLEVQRATDNRFDRSLHGMTQTYSRSAFGNALGSRARPAL